jgi:CheY-like chemotaxis protein
MNIDLVLLDIWLGDNMDGMTALDRIRERFNMPVIMISGHGTIETAVQATRRVPLISSKNRSPTTKSSSPSPTACALRGWSRKTVCSGRGPSKNRSSPASPR